MTGIIAEKSTSTATILILFNALYSKYAGTLVPATKYRK
jgi:hypothetical protein